MQQAGPMKVKADAQLGAHQRSVAKSAARACGVARKNGDGRLQKRTTLLTNTGWLTVIIRIQQSQQPQQLRNNPPRSVSIDMGRFHPPAVAAGCQSADSCDVDHAAP